MDNLTKEQKFLLVSMYKEVLSRQPALTMEEANSFNDSDEVRALFMPHLSSSYVSDLCWKLESKGYINCYSGDNLANEIQLTDETLIYMENRFSNNIKALVNFLLKLK